MSDLELERKESMTRAEVAKRLSAFAEALDIAIAVTEAAHRRVRSDRRSR